MMSFEEWSDCVISNCGHYYSTPTKRGRDKVADFRLRQRHGIDIAEMECQIDRIDRLRAGIRRDDNEYLFLLLQKSGETAVVHNGSNALLTPGDCLLMDSTRTAELHFDGRAASFISVHLPRGLCLEGRAAAPQIGHRISKFHPLQDSLLNLLTQRDHDEADDMPADYLFDFVALMFRPDPSAASALEFHDRRGRFRFACETVDRHLTDPAFSIERLAALVHMSRRQLQRDFKEHGTTFSRFLSERRARLIASHLRRAGQMNRRQPIADLAFRVGFGDLSHFNRVFRQYYGMSPRDYHASCVPAVIRH